MFRYGVVAATVPVEPGATTSPLAGPPSVSAVCSTGGSEGGAAPALLAHDVLGVVDRVQFSVAPD